MNSTNNIGYLLQHVTSLLGKQADQVLQEQLGLGLAQFRILMALQTSPHIKQREVAFNLGQTEASVSRQVKLMITQGLLHSTVNPENRRIHITAPTQKGIRLTEAATDVLAKFHTTLFAVLDSKQQDRLAKSLDILHESICHSAHPNFVDPTKL